MLTMIWPALAAQAAPLYDVRAGGLGLVGPASAHPASFLHNPAALELSPDHLFAVHLDSTLRVGHGAFQRSPIDTLTGRPAPGSSASSVKSYDEQPLLDVFPVPLLAISSNLASDSVIVTLAGHTALTRRLDFLRGGGDRWFDGGKQGPARYTATDVTQYHLFGTLAASWRIADFFVLGAGFNVVWGHLDLGFVRDTALEGGSTRDAGEEAALDDCGSGQRCDYEADAAAEGMRVTGSGWGLGFSVGVVVRPHPAVDVGLAYVSRVLGTNGEMVAKGDAWVRRSEATYLNALSDPEVEQVDRDLHGRGSVAYSLPDTVNLGVTWHVTRRWLTNLQLRWINYSVYDRLDFRFSGAMFRRRPQIPDRIDHYRGFQDVWAVQLGGGFDVLDNLTLQAAWMVETSAVPAAAVTPVTVDSTKLDWMLAASWRINRHFTLRGGYSLTWMPEVDVDNSRFSAAEMVDCVDAQFDVDLRQCSAAAAGKGLPSAAGRYRWLAHRLGASLTFHLP